MKFIILLITLTVTPNLTFAQNNFVEVTVSETVELAPKSFVYKITIGDAPNSLFNLPSFEGDDDDSEITLDEVTAEDVTFVLDKEGFTYSLSSENNYTISKDKEQGSILVDLDSKEELDRFFMVFKDFDGITGSIQDVTYEDLAEHHEEAMKALMCKAKVEAKSLAASGSKKLGDVLNIQETSNDKGRVDNWFSEYQELIMNMGMGGNNGANIKPKTEELKYTYRFELL